MVLARAEIENDYHYHNGIDFDSHYYIEFLKMKIIINIISEKNLSPYRRHLNSRYTQGRFRGM